MQIMLNALRAYCAKWRLIVNVGKTKCIVWNNGQVSTHSFSYGEEAIEVVNEFKYVGLMVTSDRGVTGRNTLYTVTIKHRLQQG